MSTREEMMVQLRSGVCNVSFTKVNGERRDMRCTLVRDMIPTEQQPTSSVVSEETESQPNESVIRVFDLTANGWRSFKVDNIINFGVE